MTNGEQYARLAEALAAARAPVALSELHGGLCGALCIGGEHAARDWIEGSIADSADAAAAARLRGQLEELEVDTLRALQGSEMSFEPLLPGEDRAIEERVHAVAAWCQGFVAGLALGGLRLEREARDTHDEIGEVVGDFVEISKASVDAHGSREQAEAEFDLAEITEYVRVGAQTIYEELAERRRSNGTGTPVH